MDGARIIQNPQQSWGFWIILIEDKSKFAGAGHRRASPTALDTQLLVNLCQVELDRAHADVQAGRYLLVREARSQQRQARLLLGREFLYERLGGALHSLQSQ